MKRAWLSGLALVCSTPHAHPSAPGPPTPPAAHHPDTAPLPPLRCLRYRLPMQIANSHRNHNSTGTHAIDTASLLVGGMVRIDGQRGPVKQQGGLFPICKNILGFIAETCQARYRSNAKSTSNNHAASIHGEGRTQRVPLPFALSLSKGPLNRAPQPADDDPLRKQRVVVLVLRRSLVRAWRTRSRLPPRPTPHQRVVARVRPVLAHLHRDGNGHCLAEEQRLLPGAQPRQHPSAARGCPTPPP